MSDTTNNRFGWVFGPAREAIPDIPDSIPAGEPVLWDYLQQKVVATLSEDYASLMTLERTPSDAPFQHLETWLNELSPEDLEAANVEPATHVLEVTRLVTRQLTRHLTVPVDVTAEMLERELSINPGLLDHLEDRYDFTESGATDSIGATSRILVSLSEQNDGEDPDPVVSEIVRNSNSNVR